MGNYIINIPNKMPFVKGLNTITMKTTTIKTLFFLALMSLFIACKSATVEEEVAEAFELGSTTAGHYHNAYFDLDIYFDSTWNVQEKEQMELMEKIGERALVEDNDALKEVLDASIVNTAHLLAIFKHPLGARVEYNPNFIALVENVRLYPGIETGADYLFHAQKLLKQTAIQYQFEEVYEVRVGTVLFHVLEVSANYMGIEVKQNYWSTINKGFCLSFILSYNTEKEQEELMQIINKVRL